MHRPGETRESSFGTNGATMMTGSGNARKSRPTRLVGRPRACASPGKNGVGSWPCASPTRKISMLSASSCQRRGSGFERPRSAYTAVGSRSGGAGARSTSSASVTHPMPSRTASAQCTAEDEWPLTFNIWPAGGGAAAWSCSWAIGSIAVPLGAACSTPTATRPARPRRAVAMRAPLAER